MRGYDRKIKRQLQRYLALLLVITMLPFSSLPARAAEDTDTVEELPEISVNSKTAETPEIERERMYQLLEPPKEDRADAYLAPEIREQSRGDMSVSGNWVLEEDVVVDTLLFSGEKLDLNGYTLIVCGDFLLEEGEADITAGTLAVWGNLEIQRGSEPADAYIRTDSSSYIMVAGDMYVNTTKIYITLLGALELKGSLYQAPSEVGNTEYSAGNLNFDADHYLILSGDDQQTIQWNGDHTQNQIGCLLIRNDSEEGIVFDGAPLVYHRIGMTRGQRVTGCIRIFGYTGFFNEYYGGDIEIDRRQACYLETDVEIDGDLILAGSLCVQHKVTVNGDLIVKDCNYGQWGESYLSICSGGNLHVRGKLDAGQTTENWDVSFFDGSCRVDGDVIADNMHYSGHRTSRFEVGGNLDLRNRDYFNMYDSSVLAFCGEKKQEVLTGSKDRINLSNIDIQNTGEEGVYFDRGDVYIGEIHTNGNRMYAEGIRVIEPFTLTEDTVIEGDCYICGGTMDLNGYTLAVEGNVKMACASVDINDGSLCTGGNLTIKCLGKILMDGSADRVCADGDLIFLSTAWRTYTDGELTVYGNLELDDSFQTHGNHKTRILRKNYEDEGKQTITIYDTWTGEKAEPSGTMFANLYLSHEPERYYTCEYDITTLAENLYYYGYPEESPTKVTGLTVSDAGYSEITICYDEATDDVGVTGYRIYRDGELVGTTEKTFYTDTGLAYHTEYAYQVYAYDDEGNESPEAETLRAATMEDVTPPEKVEGVNVTFRSASRAGLSWQNGADDLLVTGYRIYRDGELIAETKGTSYTDTGLVGGRSYEYRVTAVDRGENESEKSDAVRVVTELPAILNVAPAEGAHIEGVRTTLGVRIKNLPYGSEQYLTIDYYDTSAGSWKSIVQSRHLQRAESSNTLTAAETWQYPASLKDGDIRVRYTVSDDEGNKDAKEVTYHLDRSGPKVPQIFELSEENTNVTITWSESESADIKGYRLYGKKDGESYRCLVNKEATGAGSYRYVHARLQQESTYEYYIETYDSAENRSVSARKRITVARDETAPAPPREVYVYTRTGSSITIMWSGATDNVGVTGYNIYRDGKRIAENIKQGSWKDMGEDLEGGLLEYVVYNYSVEALDSAGNQSEKSIAAEGTVFMPEITEIIPKDQTVIGGESVDMCIRFRDIGNSRDNLTFIEWYDEEKGSYRMLTEKGLEQHKRWSGSLTTWYTLRLSELSMEESGEVRLKITAEDADGNRSEETVTYMLDKTPAKAPTGVTVTENNETVLITWEPSESTDTEGYRIYRALDGEELRQVADITGRMSGWYQDKEVEAGRTYTYFLSAYDAYNQEGEKNEGAKITVNSEDKSEPQIKSMEPEAGRVNRRIRLKVEGYDNRGVTAVDFYIRTEEETDWRALVTVSANDSAAEYNLDTTALTDGTYYIKAQARDAAGNVNQNLYQRRYEVDNTGIAKLKFLECHSYETAVRLSWKDAEEEDFEHFAVEMKKEGEKWECIREIKDSTGCDITQLRPGRSYTFRVVGYDNLGNRGEASDEIKLTTAEDESAPVIKRIDPVISRYGDKIVLKITAEDNAGMERAVFSYTRDGKKYEVLAEEKSWEKKTAETFVYEWNTEALPEGKVTIRFEAYDTAGLHNRLPEGEKEVECTYTIDHTPPVKVKNVWATDTDGCVGLAWQRGEEEDIESYCIYRSTEEDGEYRQIACKPLLNCYDSDVEYGHSYYYRVTSVDLAGNESEPSEVLRVSVDPDKTSPVVSGIAPADTKVLGKETTFSVYASDNARVAKIRMEYRLKSGGTWTELSEKEYAKRQVYTTFEWTATGLTEGEVYEIRAIAVDGAGNESEPCVKEYSFDLTPPGVPELKAEPGSFRICLSYSGDGDAQEYEILRRKAGERGYQRILMTTEKEYEDVTAERGTIYYYKVRAYDEHGNYSESGQVYSHAGTMDTIAPVAVLPEVLMAITGVNAEFDGTLSTDNLKIVKYEWDFGDGERAHGARVEHIYTKAGSYSVTLTVYDRAGNSHTTCTVADVRDYTGCGQTNVFVRGNDGLPVAGAWVYIRMDGSEENTIRTQADGNGMVTLVAEPGTCEVAAFAQGYTPANVWAEVKQGQTGTAEITLIRNDFVSGEIKIERMEPEEMIEAGVDMSDPENYHTFKFQVTMGFEEKPVPVVVTGQSRGGALSSGQGSGFKSYPVTGSAGQCEVICKESEEGETPEPVALIYMSVTQSVSWLKDMYNVQLQITNHAQGGFVLSGSTATLDIPEGLSLAATESGQSMTEQMGDIDGQESVLAGWIIRGDECGSYPVKVSYSASLMPFDVPVNRQFVSEKEIEVEAGKGLVVTVMPESTAFYGEEYHIRFQIENTSSRPLYNVGMKLQSAVRNDGEESGSRKERRVTVADPQSCEIREETIDGTVEYVFPDGGGGEMCATVREGDSIRIGVLNPGESISSKFVGSLPVSDEEHYLRLAEAFADILKGADTGAEVKICPVSSHVKMPVRYVTEEEGTTYGDPVDVTSGGFLQTFRAFMGGGSSLLDLTYDSTKSTLAEELGYGWSHSYDQRIRMQDGKLYLSPGGGGEIPFVSKTDSMNATRGRLKNTGEGEYTFLVVSRTRCEEKGNADYVPEGSAAELFGDMVIKKRTGETTEYTLTDARGSEWRFDKDGFLKKRISPEGTVFTYLREENRQVITNENTGERLILEYEEGRITQISDHAGRSIRLAYDEKGDLTDYTDEEGNTTCLAYDENHHLCKGISPTGTVLFENAYDAKGRVISQTEAGSSQKSLFAYEELKNSAIKTTITGRDGSRLVYLSDRNGNVTSETDEMGGVTVYEYNKQGQLVKETGPGGNTTAYAYDEDGNLTSMTDAQGNTITYSYDEKGNPTVITGADGSKTVSSYDKNGRLEKSITVLGEEHLYTYDADGRLAEETTEGLGSIRYTYENGRKSTETDRMGNTTCYGYDAYGNIETVTDAAGNTSTATYDVMGRLTQKKDVDGLITSYTYDTEGRLVCEAVGNRKTTYTHDEAGRVTSVTEPGGTKTVYTYDTEGNVTCITHPDGTRTLHTYDAAGRVIKTVPADNSTLKYEYDTAGRLLSETTAGQKTRYTYGKDGKKKTAVYPDGRKESYTYDQNGYPATVTDGDGNVTKYTHDAAGNLLSVTDAMGNTNHYVYDRHGNLITHTDALGNTETYAYDANGNCITKTNAEGTAFRMSYDALGRLEKVSVICEEKTITNTYAYDSAGRLLAVTDAEGGKQSFAYDMYGNLISATDEDGNTRKRTYDLRNLVTKEESAGGNTRTYVYDISRNLTQMTDENGETCSYGYDASGRMTYARDSMGGVTKAAYTADGKLKSVTDALGGVTSYAYDNLSRLTTVTDALGAAQTYTYNAQGLLQEAENARR